MKIGNIINARKGNAGKSQNAIQTWWKNRAHLKYTLPAMLVMGLLSIIPTIFLVLISFTDYQLGWDFGRTKFVGFSNYIRLLSGADPDFWNSVFISFAFMLLATGIQFVLGFAIAGLLNSSESKLKPLVMGILIIPLAMTPSIAAQMWKLMLNNEYGIINHILRSVFHVNIVWLSQDMAFWSVLLVDIWQFTPFVTLIIYAGLRSVPHEPYESAAIDGANRFQSLIYITIPMIKQLLYLAALMRAIDSLKLFDTAFILTQGGPGNATEFLSLHIFRLASAQNGLIGRAAATAMILLIMVSIISQILIRLQRKGVDMV